MGVGRVAVELLAANNALQDERTLWAVASLVVTLLVGAAVIAWFDRVDAALVPELEQLLGFAAAQEPPPSIPPTSRGKARLR